MCKYHRYQSMTKLLRWNGSVCLVQYMLTLIMHVQQWFRLFLCKRKLVAFKAADLQNILENH